MGNFDRGNRGGGRSFGSRSDRPMFKTVCSNCGNPCEVPFRPTNGKPVYCSDCFQKMRGDSDRGNSNRPRFEDRRPSGDQNKTQFEMLSVKLDRIIKLLEPKVEVVAPPDSAVPASTGKKVKKSASKKKSPDVLNQE